MLMVMRNPLLSPRHSHTSMLDSTGTESLKSNSASFNLPFSLRPLEKYETTKAGCMETCQHSLSILQL